MDQLLNTPTFVSCSAHSQPGDGGNTIDRDSFFKSCERMASDKVSFRALDRDVMERFALRSTAFSGQARTNINLIFDKIESVAPKPLDLKQVAYVLGTAYRESHGSPATKEKVWCLSDESCKTQNRKLKEYARIDPLCVRFASIDCCTRL